MTTTLRFAGAAALCAALLLGACAKKSTDQTTTTSTDTTSATSAPAAGATPAAGAAATTAPDASAAGAATSAPASAATTAATTTDTSTASGSGGSTAFITLPIYPGATAAPDGSLSSSSNTGSVDIKWYTTKDDSKTVTDWYKAHLPADFQNFVISANGKTTGTFTDEHKDGSGDQSIMVTVDDSTKTTRIQLATKHGK